jgi:uncharacterized RmlC-like cupin family protein
MRRSLIAVLACAAVYGQTPPANDRVPLDNEYVKVSRATEQPGRKSAAHGHPNNRVMIYLEAGQQQLTNPEDGKVRELKVKARDVIFDSAVKQHISENVGREPFHLIEVEIKKPAGGPPPKLGELDPPTLDPKHYKVLFDNPQVRVLRAVYGPHEKAPMHLHQMKRVSVLLTPQNVKLTMPDGTSRESHRVAGEVVWGPDPVQHSEENLSSEPYEVILVELKMM